MQRFLRQRALSKAPDLIVRDVHGTRDVRALRFGSP
jgi:hypothetical protein